MISSTTQALRSTGTNGSADESDTQGILATLHRSQPPGKGQVDSSPGAWGGQQGQDCGAEWQAGGAQSHEDGVLVEGASLDFAGLRQCLQQEERDLGWHDAPESRTSTMLPALICAAMMRLTIAAQTGVFANKYAARLT